jgi:hypothetical protein
MNTRNDLKRTGQWLADEFNWVWTENEKCWALRRESADGSLIVVAWHEALEAMLNSRFIETADIAIVTGEGDSSFRVTFANKDRHPCVGQANNLKIAMSNAIITAVCRHLDDEGEEVGNRPEASDAH